MLILHTNAESPCRLSLGRAIKSLLQMGRGRKKTIEEATCCVPRREGSVCARTRVVCVSVCVCVWCVRVLHVVVLVTFLSQLNKMTCLSSEGNSSISGLHE